MKTFSNIVFLQVEITQHFGQIQPKVCKYYLPVIRECSKKVLVAHESTGCCVYVKSKCWASQKKSVKYTQKVIFAEAKEDEPVQVLHAACKGCPVGQDGGLCQHILCCS